MDFKNMLQRNVGNMKSKMPPMPNIPKLPKIKSRKIFNLNRSKENVSDNGTFSTSQLSIGPQQSTLSLPSTSSSIINRSPSRISTISSLVEGSQQIDYNISDSSDHSNRNRRRIRFDDNNDINNDGKSTSTLRFTERLTKHYKELSEFKFSHIFGKKTIVRTTEIQVDMYKQSFQEQNNELNNERHTSRDYEFEFRSIPAASNTSADEPQTPTAPNIPRTPSISIGMHQQTQPNMQVSNVDEIRSDVVSSPPPLSRRKVFKQKDDGSPKTQKQNWKFKGFKKKTVETNDDGATSTQGSVKSKGGMWQRIRTTKITASQDGIDDSPEGTEKFKISLTNILKKLPSLSSFDEPSDSNTKSPKNMGMWKLQRPVRIKENISDETNDATDSDFVKQFNKIVGKSSKIKNLIATDSTNTTNKNVAEQNDPEDPDKVKSMEEIKSLGYGRKNLKYINKWKIRRRREIRRNEPFPLNRESSQDDDVLKTPGMWQLRRPNRVKTFINEGDPIENTGNPHLAEITKSLMSLFKSNQNVVEQISEDGQSQEQKKRNSFWKKQKIAPTTTDEYADTYMDGNSPKTDPQIKSSAQSRMWKFRQAIGTESLDTDEYGKENSEKKPGFLKKKSQKKRNAQQEHNELNEDSNLEKQNIVDKVNKGTTSRINLIQTKTVESAVSQYDPITGNTGAASSNIKNKLHCSIDSFESYENSDHQTLEDLERINKNLSWGRQNMLSNTYATDSDEEDVITKPEYLQNQSMSAPRREIEPTIIIVSKPVPSILTYGAVIQQQRINPVLPIERSSTPPTTPPPQYLSTSSQHLELPSQAVLPTPPLPKRIISLPFIFQLDTVLSPPQSPEPSPPSLPASLPPELSSPPKSLPPPVPRSPQLQISTTPTLSPILQPTCINVDNKSRSKHTRKPSMDSNDSDSWIPDNLRNRNVLEMNKIEETFEQWNSVNKSNIKNTTLKKWESIDIFNGNDGFDDFDDALRNEPVITIPGNVAEKPKSIITQVNNNSDVIQPIGVPVTFVKHKITRPLVKQGSLRRQFSEEKDAEDLNKKGSVNKMISRFDPERYSSRNIKHERIQINSANTKFMDNEEKVILKEMSTVESNKGQINIIANLNKSSSLDVEIDKSDLQSMDDSTTEDNSDSSDSEDICIPIRPPTVLERVQPPNNNNIIIQKIPDNVLQGKKAAPPPPPPINTKILIKNQIEDNENTGEQIVIKDHQTIKSVNQNNENLNRNKNILQSRQKSEDNFYSLDYTDEDETVQGNPRDGISLVKEEYSIDL